VLSQAYKYYKESMSLSVPDLCQEGVVGLMQAVDKFDPGKGYRFSTYGIYWIRNSILRAQTKSGHMLRSPHNVSTVSTLNYVLIGMRQEC
jgi:RNA polymerase sigma factor (sigma-70 family)